MSMIRRTLVVSLAFICLLPVKAEGLWNSASPLATARELHTATLLNNGQVLIAGGRDGSGTNFASAELYGLVANTWSPTGSLVTARFDHTATLLTGGQVLVIGGTKSAGQNVMGIPLATAELYDPVAKSWSSVGSMERARRWHTATLLKNGQVLVVGGYDSADMLASAELYDPVAKSWRSAVSLTAARNIHSATLLSNGQVLVVGGYDGSDALASAELFDPVANRWSSVASLTTARSDHTATLLSNGQVLVVGGHGGSGTLASAELFDPVANTWTSAGSMATAHAQHTAILLKNGTVLVAGGTKSGSAYVTNFLASAELYDPVANTWTSAGSMAEARFYHTTTLLKNGTVLVAGGFNNSSYTLASVEVFSPPNLPATPN